MHDFILSSAAVGSPWALGTVRKRVMSPFHHATCASTPVAILASAGGGVEARKAMVLIPGHFCALSKLAFKKKIYDRSPDL